MVNLKNWQKLFFLLAVGFSLCAVQACSSDDDDTMDDPSTNKTDIAVTGKVTDFSATYACINGYANLDLLIPGSEGVVNWGMIGANGIKIGVEMVGASGQSKAYTNSLNEREFDVEVHDLYPETEYKYRAFVEYGGFYHYGEYATFTTKELPCMVTTGGAAGIEGCSARITSSIKSAAVDARENFTVGVAYSKSSSFTSKPEEAIIADSRRSIKEVSNGSYTVVLDDLNGETTYYYAAFAEAGGKYSFGETKSFKTKFGPVDLGLSVKWASCNVGATKPEEYGDYFSWGGTTTRSFYNNADYPFYRLSISQLQSRGIIDSDGNLKARYDAATANWGGSWRMPTFDEMKELINNCTLTWTTQNGVKGCKVTGPNGNSIFLPAAGCNFGTDANDAGSNGCYWSATVTTPTDPSCERELARTLIFVSDDYFITGWDSYGYCAGCPVRPVTE